MKIFTSDQIRKIDAYTIENEPISSIDLMERASLALSVWIRGEFSKETSFIFIAGPGNNGGDALALARILFHYGFENIRFYIPGITKSLSPDSEKNKKRLSDETDIRIKTISKEEDFPFISDDDWIVDALFGSGLSRPLEGMAGTLVNYINKSNRAGTIAIDIPSGLFGEDNTTNNPDAIVKADYTLSFQTPKLSFFFSDNDEYVGKWKIFPIGLNDQIINETSTPYNFITEENIRQIVQKRPKFSHKGNFGHSLIIAGSYGMMGASVLATKAAVYSGSGLVTAHIPRLGYEILQTTIPEAIISFDESDIIFTGVNNLDKYNSIAVGPGINTKTNTTRALKDIIEKAQVPLVIDADALNILAENKDWIAQLPPETILTPHPGEFDRITKKHSTHYERFLSQVELSKKNNIIIVLKGAHTSISMPDTCLTVRQGTTWFNTTGNPGMAKGGSGDVLTGIICSLLAQGYSPVNAAKIGVFIHGMAGDISLRKKGGHALTPTDIINNMGRAFKKIE